MKFSVVIPNFTSREDKVAILENCLKSFMEFHRQDPLLLEVIVSDDASPVAFRPAIAEVAKRYNAIMIQKEKNEGFAFNSNAGIAKSSPQSDVILLVNNDVVFTGPVLSNLDKDFAADQQLGIVGALLFYPDGSIQHAGVKREEFRFSHIGWRKRIEDHPELMQQQYMPAVMGALLGISKKMLGEIGVFDKNILGCREETQLCLRAWLNHWKVLYDPAFQAMHLEGATRGSTLFGKIFQSMYTRKWFLEELKTEAKFMNWLKTIDLSMIDAQIADANTKLSPQQPKADSLMKNPQVFKTNSDNQTRDFLLSFQVTQRIRRVLAISKSRLFYWISKYI